MADIIKFPSTYLHDLRREYNKPNLDSKTKEGLKNKIKSREKLDRIFKDTEDMDWKLRKGDVDNLPKSSDLKPRYQMSPDEFNKHIDTQVKRKILRTSKDLPLVIEGGGSQPKQKIESAKKVGGGIKWGTAAKVAGKVLGGVGAVADLLTPPISNGKIHRHPIYDRIAEISKKQKQKRNPYSNKVTLGIQ